MIVAIRFHLRSCAVLAASLLLLLAGGAFAGDVELAQQAWFAPAEGDQPVRVPGGGYRVESEGDTVLVLTPAAGGEPLRIAAEEVDRGAPLEAAVTEVVFERGSTHLTVLREDGRGASASGSAEPVTPRAPRKRSQHGVCPPGFEIKVSQVKETAIAACVRRRGVFQRLGPANCPPGTAPTNLEAQDGSDLCAAPNGSMAPAVCRSRGARPIARTGGPDECGLTAYQVEQADMRLVER